MYKRQVLYDPLVDPKKVLLPPLHIKLGLMKNFAKAMDREGEGFKYLTELFPRLSEAKIKEGIFTGPGIRKVTRDPEYLRKTMESTCESSQGFLGNKKKKKIQNFG